jgi:hypothetical protein
MEVLVACSPCIEVSCIVLRLLQRDAFGGCLSLVGEMALRVSVAHVGFAVAAICSDPQA